MDQEPLAIEEIQAGKFDLIGVKREIHREDAKSAKKVGEPAHNPLTMRLMPSLIRGTFPFTRKPVDVPRLSGTSATGLREWKA